MIPPQHRQCKECDLHIEELTIQELAEQVGVGAEYEVDMDVNCPNCQSKLVKKYRKIPTSANKFEPTRREIGKDTLREMRNGMFGRRKRV